MTRAVLYARVSTDDQTEQYGLAVQLAALRELVGQPSNLTSEASRPPALAALNL